MRRYLGPILSLLLVIGIGAALYVSFLNFRERQAAEDEPIANVTPRPTTMNFESPPPIYAASASDENSAELPEYVCAADAFGSYFVLQQIQQQGLDVKNGFRLGIVPFFLTDEYDVSEEQRTGLLAAGDWDCLLTTLDSVSLTSAGVITAIVDESAGADQIWARDTQTLNDLRGKRLAFSRGSVGEYMAYYALSIARLNPRSDVVLVPADSVADAMELFASNQVDAVSAWEPDILDAEQSGGQPLLSTAQIRVVIDVVVTSRQSIANEQNTVQAFHDAWFEALHGQINNPAAAADAIASWGNNDWSFVYAESAEDDLRLWLESVAQATHANNLSAMRDPQTLVNRLEIARRVWASSGASVPNDDLASLVDSRFINQVSVAQLNQAPINDSFSINAEISIGDLNTRDAVTLAVLPCRRFTFLPESTELTLESRRLLDDCVVPTLSQSIGLYLEVTGSSAWPGPAGTFSEAEIAEFAEGRAQSVVDHLTDQGIDPARFVVSYTLPPEERRETEDPLLQQEDRFVEMKLITTGR